MKRGILLSLAILIIGVVTPLTAGASSGAYAALGDSVAAGAGLAGGTVPCDRSSESYPYSVAQSTGLPLQHLACTGAKIDEGLYDEQSRSGTVQPAQIQQAFMGGTPSLVTITIGANDARWTQFIRQCYYIRCGYAVDSARFAAYLVDMKLELNVALAKIHSLSSGSPPQVILTGYYQPFSNTATCTGTDRLTTAEIIWLNRRTELLNQAISGTVSKYSFADFAPVSFAGHDICSADPWIQSASDTAPFHPTATGQAAIARAVLAEYRQSPPVATDAQSYREQALNWLSRHEDW